MKQLFTVKDTMNLSEFFQGGISRIQGDLYDPRSDQHVLDFFTRPADYKRKYAYGYGGFVDRGHEYSGDPTIPDMQESYTITTGRDEPLAPELQFIYGSLFQRLCTIGREAVALILQNEFLAASGLSIDDFEYNMQINYFYPYAASDLEAGRQFRVGEHTDLGLFTIMPFGVVYDFEALVGDGWIAPATGDPRPVIFPGTLAQFLSKGNIPALSHRVRLSDNTSVRLSCPFAIIPKPTAQLLPLGIEEEGITGKQFIDGLLSSHLSNDIKYWVFRK